MSTSSADTAEKFYRYFQNEIAALQDRIEQLEQHSVAGGERNDAIEHCSAGIGKLTAEVRDIIDGLPAHDRQSYADALKALSAKFQSTKSQLSGKQKFSFKRSAFKVPKNGSAISLRDAAELAGEEPTHASGPMDTSTASSFATTPLGLMSPTTEIAPVISNKDVRSRTCQQVVLLSRDGTSSSSISNLSRSIAISKDDETVPTLSLKNISDSIVVCPRVTGPIHLTNISNTVLAVDCHQFRMHESAGCDVYLLCTSRPIIEDCSSIRFAQLPSSIQKHDHRGVSNLWDNVDDFKWLRAESSPNWSILPASEVLTEDAWHRLRSAEPGDDVSGLLNTRKRQDII